MKLTSEKFEEIRDYTFRLMSEYHSPTRLAFLGAYFDVEKDIIFILSPFFLIEINNVQMGDFINKEKPFYNAAFNEFTSYPYSYPMKSFYDDMGEFNPIGHTTYSATDIINILKEHEDAVLSDHSRYVFVQGFVQEGCAPIKFKNVNGKPVFKLNGSSKEFVILDESAIPEKYIEFDKSYTCQIIDEGHRYALNVIELFGKTKSGLIISDFWYPSYLESANKLEGLYSNQMICSNILEIAEGEIMPPIHTTPVILYDILKIFMICENPIFNLVFQKEANSKIGLESVPSGENEVFIRAYLHVKDQTCGMQRG